MCRENIKENQSETLWAAVTPRKRALRQMFSTFNNIYQLSAKGYDNILPLACFYKDISKASEQNCDWSSKKY